MALIAAFVVVVLGTPVAAAVAVRTGVVDRPGPLKVHDRPVPYLGGVAVLAGLVVPAVLGRPLVLVPLGLACLLGLADDLGNLTPRFRLACELLIGCAVLLVVPVRGPVGALAAIVAVVALINAVNLLDGLDGLATGVAGISASGFALLLEPGDARTLALGLSWALVGFLVWNRPPARIYLGDAGSYLIGTALALLLAEAFKPGQSLALAGGSVLFAGVPVADTAVAIVRRRRAGRPLLQGDRGHLYDQIVDRGRSPRAATAMCIVGQGALVAIGVGVGHLPAVAAIAVSGAVIAVVGAFLVWSFTSPQSWVP